MKKHGKLRINGVAKFSYVFLGAMCLVYLFPMYMAVIVSFSSEQSIIQNGYQIIPEEFSLEAYQLLFTSYRGSLLRAIALAVGAGIIQPIVTIFLSMCMAYPLSQADFKGRNFWRIYLVVTMLIGAGLIPSYILNAKFLGLRDNILVHVVPSLGAWSIFLFRTFFVNLDKYMVESAKIDGANKMQILFKIMLPLTKPLVVMNFFQGFLGEWNNISTSLYYISKPKLYTIQYLLQQMLTSAAETEKLIEIGLVSASDTVNIPVDSIRFAVGVIGALPVLIMFPYLQKFYAKGIAVGSTKG